MSLCLMFLWAASSQKLHTTPQKKLHHIALVPTVPEGGCNEGAFLGLEGFLYASTPSLQYYSGILSPSPQGRHTLFCSYYTSANNKGKVMYP